MDDTKPFDVVQLSPEPEWAKGGFFGGCFMVVTEVFPWGVQGYVAIPTERGKPPGQAYYRAPEGSFEKIGQAVWVNGEDG